VTAIQHATPARRAAHRPAVRRRRAAARNTATPTGWLFVAPALAVFSVFTAYPVARTFYLSLTRQDGFAGTDFVWFHNFAVMVQDPVFLKAARVTAVYTVFSTLLQTVVPLVLALVVHSGPRRSATVYRTIFFLPAAVSLTVTALLWRLGLTPGFGMVNRVLADVGLGSLAHPWLGDTATVLPTVIVVSLWQSTGLFMLIFHAGLVRMDPSILESARIDGAGPVRQAWSITVPQLRPVVELVVVINVINGFKVFDLNYVMTNGGPLHASESFSTYTYLLTFGSATGGMPTFGYGSAISVVVFLTAALATLVIFRFRRSQA
jgi:ABC-type sugar transport system permease subunit